MLQLLDHFIIAVNKVFDDGDGPIKKINEAYFIDKERDRYERKIRKGTVHAVPLAYREINHMPIDPGLPTPRLFIGHDAIQQKINEGFAWSRERHYNPSTAEGYKYMTTTDYGRLITVRAGQEVHFHPSVTEEENYLGQKDGLSLYKATVTELIFGDGQPQGGYIIVDPIAKESERDGITLSIDEEDKLLEGIVRFARPGSGFSAGEHIFFQENSNWDFWIDGKRYFAMLEENIVLTASV